MTKDTRSKMEEFKANRMNDAMSRRDILDAIENAMMRYEDINAPSQILQLLREAFA